MADQCETKIHTTSVHTFLFSWISFSGFLFTGRLSPGFPVRHSIKWHNYYTIQMLISIKLNFHCCSYLINLLCFTITFTACHLLHSNASLCLSYHDLRSPLLSTALNDQGTGRAAALLSLHNKPGFSRREQRQR